MALNVPASSSASIGTTEYFLMSASTTATYQTADYVAQVVIDLNAMAAGDQYQITVYEKVDGTNARVLLRSFATGAQSAAYVSPAFVLGTAWEIGVKKISGTDRTLVWSVRTST